jgi:hypothetical protein
MIERPQPRGLNANDTACQRRLSRGNQWVGARDLQLVNAGPPWCQLTNASLSRLSHLVKRLERRGLVGASPIRRMDDSPTRS